LAFHERVAKAALGTGNIRMLLTEQFSVQFEHSLEHLGGLVIVTLVQHYQRHVVQTGGDLGVLVAKDLLVQIQSSAQQGFGRFRIPTTIEEHTEVVDGLCYRGMLLTIQPSLDFKRLPVQGFGLVPPLLARQGQSEIVEARGCVVVIRSQ
jgi:hypothetical protein